jgi:hypothetical protein
MQTNSYMRSTSNLRGLSAAFMALTACIVSSSTFAQEVTAPTKDSAKAPTQQVGMPAMPVTPAAAAELIEVIPFELAQPFTHSMRRERPEYTRGHVLVLRAPEAYLVPRQVAEPVLLVGGQTAERINAGYASGFLIVVVPEWRERGADGVERAGDPSTARIWFASPELPERVDAAWIDAAAASASKAGLAAAAPRVAGFAPAKAERFENRDALGRFLADIIAKRSPSETDVIDTLRATN